MSQRIQIQILDKIATCLTELPVVCGNSDYEVEFAFDKEWEEHLVKTARFKVNGEYTDVVFEGNVCPMPIISNAKVVWVGVFAGNLETSTPAIVHCKSSILDGDDIPAPPKEDVYNQIIMLLNKALEENTGVTREEYEAHKAQTDKALENLERNLSFQESHISQHDLQIGDLFTYYSELRDNVGSAQSTLAEVVDGGAFV